MYMYVYIYIYKIYIRYEGVDAGLPSPAPPGRTATMMAVMDIG